MYDEGELIQYIPQVRTRTSCYTPHYESILVGVWESIVLRVTDEEGDVPAPFETGRSHNSMSNACKRAEIIRAKQLSLSRRSPLEVGRACHRI